MGCFERRVSSAEVPRRALLIDKINIVKMNSTGYLSKTKMRHRRTVTVAAVAACLINTTSADDPLSPESDCAFRNLTLHFASSVAALSVDQAADVEDALELKKRNCPFSPYTPPPSPPPSPFSPEQQQHRTH